MGKIKNLFYNLVLKPMKNYNIANRAERVMAKGNVKAPPHPSTIKDMNEVESESDMKEAFQDQNNKNEQLVQMMQDLIVNPDKVSEVRPKNLPMSQDPALDAYFDYEPETVPEGKVTLRDAMNFITTYHFYPREGDNTVSNIAEKYKLEPLDVEILLRHFKPFEIYYPLTEEQKNEYEEMAKIAAPKEGKNTQSSYLYRVKTHYLDKSRKEGNLSAQNELYKEYSSYKVSEETRAEARERGAHQEEVLKAQSDSNPRTRYDARGQNVLKDYPKDLVYFSDDIDEAAKNDAKRIDKFGSRTAETPDDDPLDLDTKEEEQKRHPMAKKPHYKLDANTKEEIQNKQTKPFKSKGLSRFK